MLRFLNWRLLMIWLGLIVGVHSAKGFSFWGSGEGYQTPANGYDRVTETIYEDTIWTTYLDPEFTFAPHNLDEEYRWSVPTLYYTYDASFVGYFGSNGIHAVDSAFGILNAVTNVSAFSADLSEFPLDEARFNFTAQALHLFDLKSAALEMLVARLGLADPERFTWNVRSRELKVPLPCPFYTYRIIQRNFDPVTFEPTKYVNGNLVTYIIDQDCPPGFPDRAEAQEFLIDPLGTPQTAVASPKITHPTISYYGMFHTGLTRDDAGGLRYLYRTNNMNVEMSPPESVLFQTNFNAVQLLFTSNLTLLANQALTNNAAQLQALYPDLVIASTTPIFTNVVSTNVFQVLTNFPWSPAGVISVASITNVTTNIVTWFSHTFANVVTNSFYTTGRVTVVETSVGPTPWCPAGQVCTNVTTRTILTNIVHGDYYILPANSDCGVYIVNTQLVSVINVTNSLVATNGTGATNVNGVSFSQDVVSYFTNSAFVIHPVPCVTNSVALRQGLEKITFVRRDFDSLLNRFFYPITNYYTMIAVTNNQTFVQRFQRIVTRPDILIAAADDNLTDGPNVETVDHFTGAPLLNNSNAIPRLAGPGSIEGPMTLTFNKVGPVRLNSGPFFITEQNSVFYFNWASFDGSTNAPIIYPNGTSIRDIESQVLIQVSPSSLPTAKAGEGYTVPLSVTGGQAPYSWTNAPGSPPLPGGLALTTLPGNGSQATLSGIPTAAGTNNFWIRLTDAGARFVDTFYVLRTDP